MARHLDFAQVPGREPLVVGSGLADPRGRRGENTARAFRLESSGRGGSRPVEAGRALTTDHREAQPSRPLARLATTLAAIACILLGAASSEAASLIGTSTTVDAFHSGSRFYSHCANGHYWVSYHDGTRPVLASSPDGVAWTPRGAIFSSSIRQQTDAGRSATRNGTLNSATTEREVPRFAPGGQANATPSGHGRARAEARARSLTMRRSRGSSTARDGEAGSA